VPPEDFEPNFRPFSYDFENNFQEEVALTQQTSGSAIDINLIKLPMHWIQLGMSFCRKLLTRKCLVIPRKSLNVKIVAYEYGNPRKKSEHS
jgi:hypothetical protein